MSKESITIKRFRLKASIRLKRFFSQEYSCRGRENYLKGLNHQKYYDHAIFLSELIAKMMLDCSPILEEEIAAKKGSYWIVRDLR